MELRDAACIGLDSPLTRRRRSLLYREAARLPSTAMPNAAPSSRVASFMAEPAPARRGGTADMIWAVMGDIANAMPEIRNTKQRNTKTYDVGSDSSRNSTNPMPTNTTAAHPV